MKPIYFKPALRMDIRIEKYLIILINETVKYYFVNILLTTEAYYLNQNYG